MKHKVKPRKPGEIVLVVKDEIQESMGYHSFPSAWQQVVKVCTQARRRGIIHTEEDAVKVASALILVGVEQAEKQGVKRVRVGHIRQGWSEMRTLGNCPIWSPKCVKTSVILREDELQDSLSGFAAVVKSVMDKIEV